MSRVQLPISCTSTFICVGNCGVAADFIPFRLLCTRLVLVTQQGKRFLVTVTPLTQARSYGNLKFVFVIVIDSSNCSRSPVRAYYCDAIIIMHNYVNPIIILVIDEQLFLMTFVYAFYISSCVVLFYFALYRVTHKKTEQHTSYNMWM